MNNQRLTKFSLTCLRLTLIGVLGLPSFTAIADTEPVPKKPDWFQSGALITTIRIRISITVTNKEGKEVTVDADNIDEDQARAIIALVTRPDPTPDSHKGLIEQKTLVAVLIALLVCCGLIAVVAKVRRTSVRGDIPPTSVVESNFRNGGDAPPGIAANGQVCPTISEITLDNQASSAVTQPSISTNIRPFAAKNSTVEWIAALDPVSLEAFARQIILTRASNPGRLSMERSNGAPIVVHFGSQIPESIWEEFEARLNECQKIHKPGPSIRG